MSKLVRESLNESDLPGRTYIDLELHIRIANETTGEDRISGEELERKFKNGDLQVDRGFILDTEQTNKIVGVIENINKL